MIIFWIGAFAALCVALGWYMGRGMYSADYENGYEKGVEDAVHDLLLATKILFVVNGVELSGTVIQPKEYTAEEQALARAGLAQIGREGE